MKSLFLALILSLSLWAEATFDQVQSMIDKQEYKQAKLALTVIANNHPNSAKVYYTLAQANAGLGDLPSARDAFNKAVALNPKLDFAPSSAVDQLREALTPPTSKIVAVYTPTHTFIYMVLGAISSVVVFFLYRRFKPLESPTVTPTATPTPSRKYDTASSTAKTHPSSYHESSIQGSRVRQQSSYVEPTPAPTVTEVHHHHHDSHKSSGMSTLGTVAVAAGTAAVVSSMMDDHSSFHHSSPIITPTYEEDTSSRSWDDDSSSSRSSSWSDSSSSSSDSWSSSDDSSSSSSWD